MTDFKPEHGLQVYCARMKIEANFRALENMLGTTRVMNKRQDSIEKLLALLLPRYAIGLLVGENPCDVLYCPLTARLSLADASMSQPRRNKWQRYSELFVPLRQKLHASPLRWRAILNTTLAVFLTIVYSPCTISSNLRKTPACSYDD